MAFVTPVNEYGPVDPQAAVEDGEAIVQQWYSEAAIQPTTGVDMTVMAEAVVCALTASHNEPFGVVTNYVRRYLAAAFQMGRAA